MQVPFHTVDVFTDRVFSGNPLAVIPDASGLTGAQMQRIAREFNYSESTFVSSPSEDSSADRRVRIFTPISEIPFAGHPTIGTACVLGLREEIDIETDGSRVVFEEGAGPVPVRVRAGSDGRLWAQLTAPQKYHERPVDLDVEALARCVGLERSDLRVDAGEPVSISCGLPFLLVRIRSLAAIRRAHLRADLWQHHLSSHEEARDLYLYCEEAEGEDVQGHVRLFAPGEGVAEDPATGSAATALAGYLGSRREERDGTFRWLIEQGLEIGRPSRLEVEAERREGTVTALRCAGYCVPVSEGTLTVPEA